LLAYLCVQWSVLARLPQRIPPLLVVMLLLTPTTLLVGSPLVPM
jgi:hypothetical protein